MSDRVIGQISALQHFSTGDGPGIRTTVFLKGCTLRCSWCHNPETQASTPELMFFQHRCTACGRCVAVCPAGVHCLVDRPADHELNRSLCRWCGACVAVCPSEALQLNGMELDLETVMAYILSDQTFYQASGGGVTLSGGEPLLQVDFCLALARSCKEHGIHVIIDTAGQVPWDAFEKIIPYADTFYFDLKGDCIDDYRQETGGDFDLILSNLKLLVAESAHVVACIVIIPGLNDDLAANERLSDVLKAAGVKEVRLLAYHQFGRSKYEALGREYPLERRCQEQTEDLAGNVTPPDRLSMEEILDVYARSFQVWLDG